MRSAGQAVVTPAQQSLPPASQEQGPVLQAPGQPQPQPQASTSLNIAIHDSKDFPADVTSQQELYSELAMVDGRVLFECPGLVKATGIDLMNCPLTVVLKLRVRRRMSQGAMVLWHVVLPLPLISKYLYQAPHEWETWIGLFPSTQSLEAYDPDTMFTQSVHLISRPDCPKLRLRFTYRHPELQAHIAAQREMQQQESRRRMELTQQVGRANFEEIHKLTRTFRDSSLSEREGSEGPSATTAAACTMPTQPQPIDSEAPRLEVVAAKEAGISHEFAPEVEQLLVEGLRIALLGMLADSDGGKAANLSSTSHEQLISIQTRYPSLWEAYREVSALAKERCSLLEQVNAQAKERTLQRASIEAAQQAESKKQFEKLLAQQRQALQLNFDTETSHLRQQLDESRRTVEDRETEVGQLRMQLSELTRQHAAVSLGAMRGGGHPAA
jgi:hypothetical protein